MKTFSYIMLFFAAVSIVCSQEEEFEIKFDLVRVATELEHSFGAVAGINSNVYNSAFTHLPNVLTCCPEFNYGSGLGFNAGLYYGYSFNRDWRVFIRLAAIDLSGTFSTMQNIKISYNNQLRNAEIRHSIDASLTALSTEISVNYMLMDNLYLVGGFSPVILVGKQFEQSEELVKPSNLFTFENGSLTRNEKKGEIQQTSGLNFAVISGVRYALPLNKTNNVFLFPELTFRYGVSSIMQNTDWSIYGITVGIAVEYNTYTDYSNPLRAR